MGAFDGEAAIAVAQLYLVHVFQRSIPAGFFAPRFPTTTTKTPVQRSTVARSTRVDLRWQQWCVRYRFATTTAHAQVNAKRNNKIIDLETLEDNVSRVKNYCYEEKNFKVPIMKTVEQVLDGRRGAIAKSWWRKGSSGSDLSLRSDNLDSVSELYTEDDLRQLVVAIEATPTFFGSLGELEDLASAVLFERHPLERTVRRAPSRISYEVRGAQMLPVLGREVEGEQRVAILDQPLDRLVVFDAPGLGEH
jgi:hypothetical protein